MAALARKPGGSLIIMPDAFNTVPWSANYSSGGTAPPGEPEVMGGCCAGAAKSLIPKGGVHDI